MITKLSLAIVIWNCVCAAQQAVEIERHENQIDVRIGGKPFTTYYVDPQVAKPYLMPLRSAQGTIVTRGYPTGNEDRNYGDFISLVRQANSMISQQLSEVIEQAKKTEAAQAADKVGKDR